MSAQLNPPVHVGDFLDLAIGGYSNEGEGVGHVDRFAVFVPGALAGEEVAVRVEQVKGSYARARLERVLRASPDRVDPACVLYGECGGCQLLHLSYPAQLEMKRQRVVDALERIGKLDHVMVHPMIGMSEQWRYRNKAQYAVGIRDGQVVAGYLAHGTHRVVPADDCAIQHGLNSRVAGSVRLLAAAFGLSIYDERSQAGFLKNIIVKNAFGTGQVMVVLVTNGARFPGGQARGRDFAQRIADQFAEVRSVAQVVADAAGDMQHVARGISRRGKASIGSNTPEGNTIVLWGEPAIVDVLDGLKFRISATSFYQVNPSQTVTLYRKAVEYAGLTGRESVLDAYSGVGTVSLFMARAAREVYGIESVRTAVHDARANAELNAITNARFIEGRVERALPALLREGVTFDVAVVDPPRAGCDREALLALAGEAMGSDETRALGGVPRIIYISCNPSTLARDLAILSGLGYRIVEVQPVDMFPHTHHVETVVSMSRVDK